ncbi:MAG: hypothetical protein WC332_00115 [Clostridia bacterium]|jgi:hypothetical protein
MSEEMKIDELLSEFYSINKVSDINDQQGLLKVYIVKQEILSLFKNLEEKVRELAILYNGQKLLYDSALEMSLKDKRQIADLTEQLKNYKCCGNCEWNHNGTSDKCYDLKKNKKCDFYQPDQLTRIEREV